MAVSGRPSIPDLPLHSCIPCRKSNTLTWLTMTHLKPQTLPNTNSPNSWEKPANSTTNNTLGIPNIEAVKITYTIILVFLIIRII